MIHWLVGALRPVTDRILRLVETLPLDAEEKTRLYHFLAFLLLGIPTMLGFGLYNAARGQRLLGVVILAMACSLLLALALLKTFQSAVWLYRSNALLFAGLLLYMLLIGGEAGSKSLWIFTFPLVTFFLLSTREGLVWTLGLFLGAACVLCLPRLGIPGYPYPAEFLFRFAVVYGIVAGLAFWFDYLRQHYQREMVAEHQRLLVEKAAVQEALSQIRQLSGLLPICAACKKVRDDDGYWTQIESYISQRSEAEFSHGICPQCAETYYPGLGRRSGAPPPG